MDDPLNMFRMDARAMDIHMDQCFRLTERLNFAIRTVMRYIFEKRCKDEEEVEHLFKAVSRAMFMKELVEDFRVNLFTISNDFLEQFDEWIQRLQQETTN
jgi:hypothetical protein